MKNQELRTSLIKSGVILTLCVFFIYAFAASDSGGVWGTIGSIFSGILFVIGLILAVTASIFVMFAIYFGILYMYNKETCKKTFEELKPQLMDTLNSLNISCPSKCFHSGNEPSSNSGQQLSAIQDRQNTLDSKLQTIQDNVDNLDTTLSTVSSSVVIASSEIAKLNERITLLANALEDRVTTETINNISAALEKELSVLKKTVHPLGEQISELASDFSSLQEDDSSKAPREDIKTAIDSLVTPLREELATVKKDLTALSTRSPDDTTEKPESSSHRILSYFENKNDEKKFVTLVAEAVQKGMTYSEAGEFLNDSLSPQAAEVIADHPSLTKDYIRTIRQAQ